ncbi:MAG: hypothetical protein FJ215_12290 [Ignavibacteria bacterium]|nr:hypothetical protein [Ignavibacteria bacterium]
MREHSVGIRYIYGFGGAENGLTFNTVQVEASLPIWGDIRALIAAPWTNVAGPLGSANGLGDITLILSSPVWSNDAIELSFHLGGKLATGAVNEGNLAQAYQPGLGTNDLLFGAAVKHGTMRHGVGYQFSRQRSANNFTRLERGDDLLLRVGYFTHIEMAAVSLELLGIQRIHESTILRQSIVGGEEFVRLADSDQLQINLLGSATYLLTEDLRLAAEAALPFLQRDINVDGLKRVFSAAIGLTVQF